MQFYSSMRIEDFIVILNGNIRAKFQRKTSAFVRVCTICTCATAISNNGVKLSAKNWLRMF